MKENTKYRKDIGRIIELLSQVLELHAKLRPDIFVSGTTKYTEKELNYISRMCPMNDAMMQVMFEDNVELVEYILRLMTGIHDLTVLRMETQKNINGSLLYKSVRFDVYAVDSVGRKYNLEIQNKPSGAPGDRARYYMGMMDTHSVKKGEEEIILPQTYVIFIVTSTSYEIRKPLYHFIEEIAQDI